MMHARINPSPDGLIVDWHPYPDLFSFVLNYIAPIVVIVLFLIAIKAKKEIIRLSSITGILVSLVSLLGVISLGYYMYSEWFGDGFRATIWWF
jgi:uncharacterized membrane protein